MQYLLYAPIWHRTKASGCNSHWHHSTQSFLTLLWPKNDNIKMLFQKKIKCKTHMQVKLTLSEKFDDLKLCNFYFYRMFPHTFSPLPSPSDVCVTHCTGTESDWTGAKKLRTRNHLKWSTNTFKIFHIHVHVHLNGQLTKN